MNEISITEYTIENNFKYRTLVISDFHNSNYHGLYDILDTLVFDNVFLVGDIYNDHTYSNNSTYSNLLMKYLSKRSPVYFSLGNHEWNFDTKDIIFLKNIGIKIIDNCYIKIINNVYIGGLSSPLKYEKNGVFPEYYNPNLNFISEFDNLTGYKILLSHHPEYYDKYLKSTSIDLIISGHAHGGQIRIGKQGLIAPGQGLFPKYTSGMHDNRLIISRGLTNTIPFIPRINNRPEILLLTFSCR